MCLNLTASAGTLLRDVVADAGRGGGGGGNETGLADSMGLWGPAGGGGPSSERS